MRTSPTRAILMAGAATLSLSVAAYASEFNRVIVFGDRYLDAGQYVDSSTVFPDDPDEEITTDGRGRFTNLEEDDNTGHAWGTLVSRILGHGDTFPNQPQTLSNSPEPIIGTNYAAGFNDTNDILESINGTPVIEGITYADDNGEQRSVDGTRGIGLLRDPSRTGWVADSIVLMNGGARDIRSLADVDLELDGAIDLSRTNVSDDAATINSVAQNAARNMSDGAVLLRDAGAGLVVVSNLIDVGMIPEVAGDAANAQATIDAIGVEYDFLEARLEADFQAFSEDNPEIDVTGFYLAALEDLNEREAEEKAPFERVVENPELVGETRSAGTDAFNAQLAANLDGQDDIIIVDQRALYDAILENPVRFGLGSDVVPGEDCAFDTVLFPCNEVEGSLSEHLFVNGVDFTTTAHEMFAQQAASIINAPVQVSGLAFTAIASGREVANAGRAQVSRERIARKGWAPFISAGIGSSTWNDISGEGRHGSVRLTGTAGATYHLGNGYSVGAAAAYQDISDALSGTAIDIDGSAVYGTVFAGADVGNVFGNASLTLGSVDLDEVNRTVSIGAATIDNSGDTDGTVFGASVEVGYRALRADSISAGPIASLDHWSSDIDGYNESGWSATAVNYGDIDGDSTRVSLGLFLEGGDLDYADMPAVFRVKALYTRELDTDPITVTASAQSSPNNSFSREGRSAQADSLTIGAQLVYDFGPFIGSLNYDARVGEADDHSGSIDISVPLGGK